MIAEDLLEKFQERLGYSFTRCELLQAAITHVSLQAGQNRHIFQRFEFLGDRILGFLIADILFKAFPDENEGILARRHANLVCARTLTEIAKEIKASEVIKTATGSLSSSVLADVMESLIAAIYMDGGLDECQKVLGSLWGRRLYDNASASKDPKTLLQEWAHAHSADIPVYRVVEQTGTPHAPHFIIKVSMSDKCAHGSGPSKRIAMQKAAEKLLNKFKG